MKTVQLTILYTFMDHVTFSFFQYIDYYGEEEKLLIEQSMARIAILASKRGGILPEVFSDAVKNMSGQRN